MLSDMSVKIDRFTHELLKTAPFDTLENTPIPSATAAEFLRAFEQTKADLKTQVEKDNPDGICPQTLKNTRDMRDDYLRASVTQALAGLQTALLGIKYGYIK